MANASKIVDVLVVGGGVFGLWSALKAAQAGLNVLLIDKNGVGSGASGGVLGTLAAYAPHRWDDRKSFQRDALLRLEYEVAALETQTARRTGYRRIGRISPLRSAAFRRQISDREVGAKQWWSPIDPRFTYSIDPAEIWTRRNWINPDEASYGIAYETLAARIAPWRYIDALRAAVLRTCRVVEGIAYQRWHGGRAILSNGENIAVGAVVFAHGWCAFRDMEAATAHRRLGTGVKGQAVLLRPGMAQDWSNFPLIYDDNIYITPHENGLIGVGSTSETNWSNPCSIDKDNDGFLQKARQICPAIRDAEIVRWWAGVRPKSRKRNPIVGRLPCQAPLWAMTGGFKIGLGLAHHCATALVERLIGVENPMALPKSFQISAHFDRARH
jgi:glycine/D-amino acid oxidase-like deaminating enzyme